MNFLAKSFFKGLLIVIPTVVTAYVVYLVVSKVDGMLGVSIPGLGLLLTFAFITFVGFLTSNVVGKSVISVFEKALGRLPVVKLIYSSIRDLMGAFVGDKKSFDQPVMVDLDGRGTRVLGFITCKSWADPKLKDHVAVYLPQSYNFAGNLIIVPRERVEAIDADGAQFMAFIVSGGVAELQGASTVMDGRSLGIGR